MLCMGFFKHTQRTRHTDRKAANHRVGKRKRLAILQKQLAIYSLRCGFTAIIGAHFAAIVMH